MELADGVEFDAVVIGTALPNAILAAALARVDKRVLHIDSLEFYGQEWATFSLKELRELPTLFSHGDPADVSTAGNAQVAAPPPASLPEGRNSVSVQYRSPVFDVHEEVFPLPVSPPPAPQQAPSLVTDTGTKEEPPTMNDSASAEAPPAETPAPEAAAPAPAAAASEPPPPDVPVKVETPEERRETALAELMKQARRYNLDLLPKACLSRGSLIQLLISSNIGRYLEFKAVAETYIRMGQENREVPCSKQTLLLNKSVAPKEKRHLMKFLQFCTTAADDSDASEAIPTTAFLEYLKSEWKFSDDLAQYIIYAIGNVTPETSTREALRGVREFFSSLGQYGKTPYIYPLYGVGEVPQAFCRLCAVFGGTYMLRQRIDGFVTSDNGSRCTGIVMGGKRVDASWVITTSACVPSTYPDATRDNAVARAVVVTDGTVVPECGNHPVVTLCIPPNTAGNPHNVNAFCFSSDSSVCPSGKWVTQFVSASTDGSARESLEAVVNSLTADPDASPEADEKNKRPNRLYSMYFGMHDETCAGGGDNELGGLLVSQQPPLTSVTFQSALAEARRMFDLICPGEEFLPMAPNPEDIDWGPPQPTPEEIEARLNALEHSTAGLWESASDFVERIDAVTARSTRGRKPERSNGLRVARVAVSTRSIRADVAQLRERLDALNARTDKRAPKESEA